MNIFKQLTIVWTMSLIFWTTLSHAQIDKQGNQLPVAQELIIRPYVQYHTPGEATLYWKTDVPGPSIIEYGSATSERKRVKDAKPKTDHSVNLSGLDEDTVYLYSVTTESNGKATTSADYSFDTTFNYTVKPIDATLNPYEPSKDYAQAAEQILRETGITEGYCLVYAAGRGQLAFELAKRSELIVLGVDDDMKAISEGRQILSKAGVYGDRITLMDSTSLDATPFTANYANLIVSDRALTAEQVPGTSNEVLRVLRPNGGVAYISGTEESLKDWVSLNADSFTISKGKKSYWAKSVKAPLPNAGSWSHQYGNTTNNSNSGDTLGGAGKTNEMRVQWLGRPGADFGIDRNPRMPAPLSMNGRLFHQGLNRVCGLDMYNGAMLWMLEVPGLRRVNIPRDAANWCLDEDSVYMAIEGNCWSVDAQTGSLDHLYQLPEKAKRDTHEWGLMMQEDERIFGSTVIKGGSYTTYWGKEAWYDQREGTGTFKVCSDSLFSITKNKTEADWTYKNGLIINATVTIADNKIYFVETRNDIAKASKTGRVEVPEIWLDQYLVALDANTGELLWEQAIDTEDGIVVFYLTYANDMLLITSSLRPKYHLYGFSAKDGSQKWHSSHDWVSDNHGSHMIHPAVTGDTVFLEPMGYSVATGEKLRDDLGRREGCATVAATSNALIYRGENRRVAMWDIEEAEVTSWMNLRPSCWLSVVPSGGMILAPEGGGGCSCGNWVETSLGFLPDFSD